MKWSVVNQGAYNDDGSLFFPEKLSQEFLDNAKKTMGSYLFANQYLNEIIPSELQTFKKDWLKYYKFLPKIVNTFITIDPALSEADGSDFTGVVVCHVDIDKRWYVSYAQRHKVSPTQLVDLVFKLNKQFSPQGIGIEQVSYQKALLYFLDEEMRRRDELLPVSGIQPPTQKTKQMRVLSLVPRFEWGHIFLSQGLQDLELELLKFPRGAHDDLIDALAYIDYIAFPPQKEKEFEKQPGPQHPDYERWYIHNLRKRKKEDDQGD